MPTLPNIREPKPNQSMLMPVRLKGGAALALPSSWQREAVQLICLSLQPNSLINVRITLLSKYRQGLENNTE